MTEYFDSKGKIRLGDRIGKGGEGEVYLLHGNPKHVVKIYTIKDLGDRRDKIISMIQNNFSSDQRITFPIDVIRDNRGIFRGFTMNKIEKSKPLFLLYAPGARKQNFPNANYAFLVRVATNIAKSVKSVHVTGCVIGDINQSGVLISDDAIATLIDADSFQFIFNSQRFLCKVGTLDYTAPELQGLSLHDRIRTKEHDAFGLAVIIFQLLFMGRHPFSGSFQKGEIELTRAIKEHRFAYSEKRNVQMIPPPGTPRLSDFPEGLQALFEQAFSQNSNRPSAEKWADELQKLENSLIRCGDNKAHLYPNSSIECIWCRIERDSGVELFLNPNNNNLTSNNFINSTLNNADLDSITILPFDLRPMLFSAISTNSSISLSTGKKSRTNKYRIFIKWISIISAPVFFLYSRELGFFAVGLLIIIILFSHFLRKKRTNNLKNDLQKIDNEINNDFYEIYRKTNFSELHQRKSYLDLLKNEILLAPQQSPLLLNQLKNNRYEIERNTYLERFFIRNASIDNIHQSLLGTLASYGIETAADVKFKLPSLKIPGIGPERSSSLQYWLQGIERNFRFIDNPSFLIREKALVDQAIKDLIRNISNEFSSELEQLKRNNVTITAQINSLIAPLKEKLQRREDLALELRSSGEKIKDINLSIPSLPNIPRRAMPIEIVFRSGKPVFTIPKITSSVYFSSSTSSSNAFGKPPNCPQCNRPMIKKFAKRGSRRGRQFWGCQSYPTCRGTRNI